MSFVKPLPSLQTLRAFLAVAEAKSFTRAAEELRLTQTAVSHQIAQLEDWVQGRLFVRDRRQVALTTLGAKLLPSVGSALAELERSLDEARRTSGTRRLRISTTPEFAEQWLTPRLPLFCEAHSEIDVSVTVEYRRAQLDVEEADVAIWLGRGPSRFDAERLTEDQEFAVCSPDLAFSLPKRDALLAAPLLRYEGARHTVLDWRRWYSLLFGAETAHAEDELSQQIDFEGGPVYRTFGEMIDACRRGEGFALVRDSLVAQELAAGSLVRCFDETVDSDLQYHLVTSPSERKRPEVEAFRTWLFSTVNEQIS